MMKKITMLFAFMMAVSFAFSQISLGPKIGFNTSKLTDDADQIKTDLSTSFNFGAFVRLGKKIYIQPEVNWLTRGGVFETVDASSLNPIKQEIELKTIEIPLLVGWRVINLGVGNIRIMAGPSASIVTNSSVSTTSSAGLIGPIKDTDLDDFEDLVWGFNAGVGVDILMFTLDVRYQMGLNEVIPKIENFDFYSKSNIFAVSLGWKII
jgi:hypothetical protein